jgi:hypothetical protein
LGANEAVAGPRESEATITCPSCRSSIPAHADFCPVCGTPVRASSPSPPMPTAAPVFQGGAPGSLAAPRLSTSPADTTRGRPRNSPAFNLTRVFGIFLGLGAIGFGLSAFFGAPWDPSSFPVIELGMAVVSIALGAVARILGKRRNAALAQAA